MSRLHNQEALARIVRRAGGDWCINGPHFQRKDAEPQSRREAGREEEDVGRHGLHSSSLFFSAPLRLCAFALNQTIPPRPSPLISLFLFAIFLAGCHRDMYDQPRYEPLETSTFFPDGMSARPPVAGTVARGQLNEDEALYTGRSGGELVTELPVDVDRALLDRGHERFNIYCSPCHDRAGTGNGMIVQRGFRRPPSYHIDRLRNAPHGHYFDVMTNGFGAMPSYRVQIEPRDRWAIVAYIRVLQMSQNATLDDVPHEERATLEQPPAEEATP